MEAAEIPVMGKRVNGVRLECLKGLSRAGAAGARATSADPIQLLIEKGTVVKSEPRE
jgi:hypothetical protein